MNKKATVIISILVVLLLVAAALWYVFVLNKKFEVSFNSAGGSTIETQQVINKKLATVPAEPTREYCHFDGWFLGEEAFNFETPITENIGLTARWTCDSVMVCKINEEKEGIVTLEGELTLVYDTTGTTIKDANGQVIATFKDEESLNKHKNFVIEGFCPADKVDPNKCKVTPDGSILKIEVLNEINIMDTTKTMEEIKTELETENSFQCERKEV